MVVDTDKYFLYGHEFLNKDNCIRYKYENETKFNQFHAYLRKLFKIKNN